MRYIIPAGTPLLTAHDVRHRAWKPHTARRALVFPTYRLKDADEITFAYRGRLLRVARSAVQELPDDGTVLYSLIFSLVTDPPEMRDLVVQLDEHAEGRFARPADPRKTLLDVGPGRAPNTILLLFRLQLFRRSQIWNCLASLQHQS